MSAVASWYGSKRSGEKQARAARQAGEREQEMQEKGLALAREMWETGREDIAPFREFGQEGLDPIRNMLAQPFDFQSDPYTRAVLEGAQGNFLANQAARHRLFSGDTPVGMGRVAGDVYSGAMQNYLARLGPYFQRVGLGQTTAGGMAAGAQRFGESGANMLARMGQTAGESAYSQGLARAAGTQGRYGAIADTLGTVESALMRTYWPKGVT